MSVNKLELTWCGKGKEPLLEPRIQLLDDQYSYVAPHRIDENDSFDNRLIFGDNLLALKSLLPDFEGQIQCIYIDPPYNTGSAFTHYQDSLEHSLWLSFMRDRLQQLRKLLAPTGVIFVSIDDDEGFYLKVLMDEVFQRKNYCGHMVWEKKKKPSFLNSNMGSVTEFVLCYAKRRISAPPFLYGTTTRGKKYPLNNAGNGKKVLTFPAGSVQFGCGDRKFAPQDMSDGNIYTVLLDELDVRDNRNYNEFRLEGEWRYSQARLDQIIESGETIVISKAPFRPNHIKAGGEPKKLKNLLSVAHYQMSTYEDATEESRLLFGSEAFDYPKPEKLLETLIGAVTEPGDIVLDSFAGSGTTGAVAHKMGRRWIMIELGDHCHSHIIPRMRRVIDGTDQGGISNSVGWKGGGGFQYYRLAPTLLKRDKYGRLIINEEYNAEMLAEAMCKHMGFVYDPSQDQFWIHGRRPDSDERSFLYVTTQHLGAEILSHLSEEVGDERHLVITCCSYDGDAAKRHKNLEVQKIPQLILNKCEFGEDYEERIANLGWRAPEPDPGSPKEAKARAAGQGSLLDGDAPFDIGGDAWVAIF